MAKQYREKESEMNVYVDRNEFTMPRRQYIPHLPRNDECKTCFSDHVPRRLQTPVGGILVPVVLYVMQIL